MTVLEMVLLVVGIILIVGGAFRVAANRVDLGWIGTALVFTAMFLLPHVR